MKNIKTILNHLPIPYDKIKIQKCLHLLISGFPIHLKNNISFMYLKGETLYFVTKHQAINFELYQKLNDILSMLKFIQKKTNKCLSIKITSIKTYTEKYKKRNINTITHSDIKFYKKIAKGNFKNLAKNKKIYEKLEEIREILRKKNK